ncbi:unnamed protein product [Amaranthus hypochondriacus]
MLFVVDSITMEETSATPDAITFVALLSTCAQLGLVNEGKFFFSSMIEKYEITPIMEHYVCLVNLYGRAGMIDEAYDIISTKWSLRLDRQFGEPCYILVFCTPIVTVELAARHLFELEPDNEHNFELLIRVYDNLDRLEDPNRVKMLMIDRGLDS